MDPARRRADRSRDIFQKRDDIVICSLFDLVRSQGWRSARASGSLLRRLWESGQARPSLRRQAFQSRARFRICAAPTKARASPAGNNDRSRRKIRSPPRRAKRFCEKENAAQRATRATFKIGNLLGDRLADAGAGEAPVIFHPHLAAAEKIGDRRHRLLGVLGA